MTRRNNEFVVKFDKGRRTKKIYEYPRSDRSLQFQLLDRAINVAERKRIVFSGDAALWLRELVEATSHRVMSPLGEGAIAFNDAVVHQINKAFSAITAVVEAIAFEVKAGSRMTLDSIQDIFRRLCPLPPVC